MNPYFTVNDSEHFTFYRIPKLLFTDEIYQTVSTDAKMLYGPQRLPPVGFIISACSPSSTGSTAFLK